MLLRSTLLRSSLCALLFSAAVPAQMLFEEYDPPSTLVVAEHEVTHARYPFVDVHNHQWSMPSDTLADTVAEMDALNMAVMVNLSGRGRGDDAHLAGCLSNAAQNAPSRFLVFTNISFEGIDDPDWGARTADQVEADVRAGAAGLKIYKNLGMSAADAAGFRIPTDDPRIDPVWERCGQLGVPVLIHTGDPAPFWQPWDDQNERWFELKERPNRKRDPSTEPSFEEVMAEQHRVFERHPGTTFISAHMGWMANDLARLGELLDRYPNVHTEIGAVLAELGRQPRTAAAWLTEYQDRVLFGKDSWTPSEYHVYFRVLETEDEYFDYYRKRHGHWKMYGMALPDTPLRKLYYGNALKLFPQIDRSLFPNDGVIE
ncbi:MAG: hypothetical protein DHS20C15_26070 [Planctomycetota bacterium]|nr:MAG: hypothetical protein DHS20C15_26070 [Planctomycetota bacterium]